MDTSKLVAFVESVDQFLSAACPEGSGKALSRSAVVVGCGFPEERQGLISELIQGGFLDGWVIRQGRDGGVTRASEVSLRPDRGEKFSADWVASLNEVLEEHVPTTGGMSRNDIARYLSAKTGQDVLLLPQKISEAMKAGKCPGFELKKGTGILRTTAAPAAATPTPETAPASQEETSTPEVSETTEVETATNEEEAKPRKKNRKAA